MLWGFASSVTLLLAILQTHPYRTYQPTQWRYVEERQLHPSWRVYIASWLGQVSLSSEKASLWTGEWSLTNVITGLFCTQITRGELSYVSRRHTFLSNIKSTRASSRACRSCWAQPRHCHRPSPTVVTMHLVHTSEHTESICTSDRTCSSSVT